MAEASPTTDTADLLDRANAVLIGNYARRPVVMDRGEGSYVWDTEGRQYLDLFAGFGGAVLGHCHPELVAAATEQANKLWHVGNVFHTEPQVRFAEHLNAKAFGGKAFFCHGGLDANEAAVKLARLHGDAFRPKRWKTVTFNMSFHGRSLAMIAAGWSQAHREGFGPPVPGFVHARGGSFDDLLRYVDDETCAIMFEPIQGEGGMNEYPAGFAQQVRQLCDERQITLIMDEVWTGGGRTGKWFGHQHLGITPDIMTLGKAIGGGLAVGAMWARPELADLLVPGKHGSTLGGNPISMNVAATIFDVIERDSLLAHAAELGEHAKAKLTSSLGNRIKAVRGQGLFLGIELSEKPADLIGAAMEQGVLLNVTQEKVVRLAPALTITKQQWDQGLDAVIRVIESA